MPIDRNMTRDELILRIAEQADRKRQNATTGKIEASMDEPDRDVLLRALEDGIREFEDCRSWAYRDVIAELDIVADGDGPLNIDGDPCRYLLPAHFTAIPSGEPCWSLDDNTGGEMSIRHISIIKRSRFLCPTEIGTPRMIGGQYSADVAPGLQQSGGIEVQVWPKPDDDYTVCFSTRIGHSGFVEGNERGKWPAVHDLTIVAFAVRRLFLSDRAAGAPAKRDAEAEVARRLEISTKRDDDDHRPDEATGLPVSVAHRVPRLRVLDNTTGTYLYDPASS